MRGNDFNLQENNNNNNNDNIEGLSLSNMPKNANTEKQEKS